MFSSRDYKIAFVCALLAFVATAEDVSGQAFQGLLSGKKQTAAVTSEDDPLKRTSPRSSIYNFLEACHENNFLLASQYLDLKREPSSPGTRACSGAR